MDAHRPGEQKPYLQTEEHSLRYLLYLPSRFDDWPEKQWPVLCFLHGAGEAARNQAGEEQAIEALLRHGSPPWHCEINSPLIRDFIVLSPQLPARSPWTPAHFEKVVVILHTVYTNFRGARDRTFLTGFSYGGRAVFDFAVWAEQLSERYPRNISWAALWPVDDAHEQGRVSCPVRRIWLHFGAWRPDPQRVTAANLELAPVEAFRHAQPQAERLYTDYGRLAYDHAATCAVAYADWRVYEWLLR